MTFRILCDVHIAYKVVRFFKNKGYEAIHVNDILDGFHTKDADFTLHSIGVILFRRGKNTDFQRFTTDVVPKVQALIKLMEDLTGES